MDDATTGLKLAVVEISQLELKCFSSTSPATYELQVTMVLIGTRLLPLDGVNITGVAGTSCSTVKLLTLLHSLT